METNSVQINNYKSIFTKHFLNGKNDCNTEKGTALKKDFNEISIRQMQEYISLLESNLILNKQLVLELCDNSKKEEIKLIALLTKENSKFQDYYKKSQFELEKMQSQYLCLEQLFENYKQNEAETTNSLTDRIEELSDQLNRKEYIIQYIESKLFKEENLLKRIQKKYPDLKGLFGEFEYKNNEFRITNIIDENERLQEENKKFMKTIHDLEIKIKTSFFNSTFSSSRGKVYSPLSTIDLNRMPLKKENFECDKKDIDNISNYLSKISELEEQNKERNMEFEKLEKVNLNLIKLNIKQTNFIKNSQIFFEKVFSSEFEKEGKKIGFFDKIRKKYLNHLQNMTQDAATCDYNLDILVKENNEIKENYNKLEEKFVHKNLTNFFDRYENISKITNEEELFDSIELEEFEQ